MQSSTNRLHTERQKQHELRNQIERLKAQLTDIPDDDSRLQSPKRKKPDATLLAPATPSPSEPDGFLFVINQLTITGKKRRTEHTAGQGRKPHAVGCSSTSERPRAHKSARSVGKPAAVPHHAKPAPSNVLNKLAALRPGSTSRSEPIFVVRSSDLAEKPKPKVPEPYAQSHALQERGFEAPIASTSSTTLATAPQRDENLVVVEDLQMGPADHKPPPDDPLFEHLEPNSGIHLLSRSLSHEDLQEYLRGRYYLSPSRLYSCIRLLPNKSGYDVPVEGDWVTIAVVAERGPVKHTRAPVDATHGDDGCASDDETGRSKPGFNPGARKKSDKNGQKGHAKLHGKKYVSMKLIDFGARSRTSTSGGNSAIRGDAFLTLLLFESDGFDKVTGENGSVKKIYQGGSKGAFEAMSKLKEGDVVALLNPKVLKPLQRNDNTPHPVDNILAVTPESATSIAIIGRARDLGMCKVAKKDGKPCGSWTDKRVSDVCEWHLTNAVQRQRAGRPEFSAGTSGMTTTSTRKRKPEYDPSRQCGLQPEPAAGSSVYIVSGHVVGGAARDMFMAEKLGREAQEKAKRRLGQDADKELKTLLDRDKEGMRAVTKAREVAAKMLKASDVGKQKGKANKVDKGKGKAVDDDDENEEPTSANAPAKLAYSASVIKHLGFDPAAKAGQKRAEDLTIQKKLEALAAVQGSRKDINLARRPGPKIRSGVSVPAFMVKEDTGANAEDRDSDLDVVSGEDEMVDLDDSSDI
ncbi:hypothetical protein J3R83DRAFT_11495 [Lanmaoa asiatica]|nr:hypothetical protein J3R83DRAFT_11495 [Lanmaoa asiatica]